MNSGLYALAGDSATATLAACANRLDEPMTNVSNMYFGLSRLPPLSVPPGSRRSAWPPRRRWSAATAGATTTGAVVSGAVAGQAAHRRGVGGAGLSR